MRFSLRVEANLIDGIIVSHAVVKHRLVNDYMLGGQLLEGGPFFVVFGFMGLGGCYNRLRVEKFTEMSFPFPRKDLVVDRFEQVPRRDAI